MSPKLGFGCLYSMPITVLKGWHTPLQKCRLPSWVLHYDCCLHPDSYCQLCSRNPGSAQLRLSLIYIVVDTVDRSSYPLSISLYSQKAFPISVPSFIPHHNNLSPINPNQQVWESLCTGIMKHSLGGDA